MKHYIIPLFIPHYGCTHQCIFCNQREITGQLRPVSPEDVISTIKRHLALINEPRFIEVAFYGGSFTALPLVLQQSLLEPAYRFKVNGQIDALRVSTRPDCINEDIVDFISDFGVRTIELGVQSMDDQVLALSGRGHTAFDVENAVKIIKHKAIKLGIQVMVGLPGDDWRSTLHTTKRVIALKPDLARIYPTLVIQGTQLAKQYCAGSYSPLTLTQAVARSAFLKNSFETAGIHVIRTGLQATEELSDARVVLAGPYHPSFGEMVDSYHLYIKIALLVEDMLACCSIPQSVVIHYHKRDESKLYGLRRMNLHKWHRYYPEFILHFKDDGEKGQLYGECGKIFFDLSKNFPG